MLTARAGHVPYPSYCQQMMRRSVRGPKESVPWPGIQGGQGFRLRVMARAQVLGNVSQACREFGISQSLFCRWRKLDLAYGPDGLHARRNGACLGRPPELSIQEERTVLAWGPVRLAQQLRGPEYGSLHMAASTVYRHCGNRSFRRVGSGWQCWRLTVPRQLPPVRAGTSRFSQRVSSSRSEPGVRMNWVGSICSISGAWRANFSTGTPVSGNCAGGMPGVRQRAIRNLHLDPGIRPYPHARPAGPELTITVARSS